NGRMTCGDAYGLPMLTFTSATPSRTIAPTHHSGSVRSGSNGSSSRAPQALRTGGVQEHGSPSPPPPPPPARGEGGAAGSPSPLRGRGGGGVRGLRYGMPS